MQEFITSPFNIGGLTLPNRLIQGPLAGYSCAPFRQLFYRYTPPAYCVSEMLSARDVLSKHQMHSRLLYRAPEEKMLCYQLSGSNPAVIAQAAQRLQGLGADLIDLNCGCPKLKIRKKGAGSALLGDHDLLLDIVRALRAAITIPFTVKIRIQGDARDVILAKKIADAGADALIVHGRRWTDDYDKSCDYMQISSIKQALSIPVIANGDIADSTSLAHALSTTGCDAFMIARAGSGNPWLYQQLLENNKTLIMPETRIDCFMEHLQGLARIESEHQAVLQSKSLARYYFRGIFADEHWPQFYTLDSLKGIHLFLQALAGLWPA